MCNKTIYCPRCNWAKVNEYGDVRLCQCDLKEVADACEKIKQVKVSSKSYFIGFKEQKEVNKELSALILEDFEELLKNE
jgi:hypothetical protein